MPEGVAYHVITSPQISDIRFLDVQSGFGYVFTALFRATPQSAAQKVVLKVPKSSPNGSDWDAKAFNEEVAVLGAVVHAHVVRLIGVWPALDQAPLNACGAAFALVMAYVDGGTLTSLLQHLQRRSSTTTTPSANATSSSGSAASSAHSFHLLPVVRLELLWQVCSAVACLHAHGVVHRDLKPDNVLVGYSTGAGAGAGAGSSSSSSNQLHVKLCDFGLSVFLTSNELISLAGTLQYAAPEQLTAGAVITSAVDVYAFGCVMYFL
jgi:serine/threonine protein kinase